MARRSSKPPGGSAFDAGLRHLARRAHSRSELNRKLRRRGYDEDDVEKGLDRLAEMGYLDDAAFAVGHVRRRSPSLGPAALAAELAARGVDRRLTGVALGSLSDADQLAAAVRLVQRQGVRKPPASYQELLDSAGTKLLRRGFSLGIAREACRAVWLGTSAN